MAGDPSGVAGLGREENGTPAQPVDSVEHDGGRSVGVRRQPVSEATTAAPGANTAADPAGERGV